VDKDGKMKIKIVGGEIRLLHKLKRNEMYKVSKSQKFQSLKIYKKPQLVKGISNVCEDQKGIITVDYDEVDKSIVLEDYKYIQEKFKLPPGYLFTTKEGNFHVICLYKALQSTIFEILSNTRCDSNFRSMPLRNPYRSYVLRISQKQGSKKPKFLELIGRTINLDKEISSAHYNLISKIHKKLPMITYKKKDNLTKLKIHTYETS
jgi:hypothetical protein